MKVRFSVFTAPLFLVAISAATCEAGTQQATTSPGGYDLSRAGVEQHRLPARLHEVSGLVLDGEGRLFAHDDEVGIVYEIDPGTGEEVIRFGVGDPTAEADFEGIAALGDELYLITSAGSLLTFKAGNDRQRVPFERVRTGIGPQCEIEGLAEDPEAGRLLVACKQSRTPELASQVTVFAIDVTEGTSEIHLVVPWERIRDAGGARAFHPSGLSLTPDGSRLFIISARQRSLLELTPSGEVLGVHALGRWHLQPEGIAFARDGSLLISDEGGGGRARLSRYPAVGSRDASARNP